MLDNTLLHTACSEGNIENVDLALNFIGNDIDAKNNKLFTALHIACKLGRSDIALKLIEFGADINGKPENICRLTDTPLQLAILKKDLDLVKLLIKKGADVNAKNHNNFTALHIASFKGFIEIVEELIINNAKINDIVGEAEIIETPLHLACQNNNYEIIELLLENKANVNAVDANQNNPLHYSAWNNSLESISLLLKYNTNLESRNGFKKTPLHYAIQNNSLEAANLLLEKGADPHALDCFGRKPYFYAVDSSLKQFLQNFNLKKYIAQNNPRLIQEELIKLKESSDLENTISSFEKDDIMSPIIEGAGSVSAKIESLKLLSSEGFDIYKTNDNGDNLLSLALKKGDEELIREIFKEENGFDLAKLSNEAIKKIESIKQIASCFSCLSFGNILTIKFTQIGIEKEIPSIEIRLEKETSKRLITALESGKEKLSATLGFSSSPN